MDRHTPVDPVLFLCPENPRRPVDWRWQAVAWKVATGGKLPFDDGATRLALAFQMALAHCRRSRDPESALRQLIVDQPACYWAWDLEHRPANKSTRDRLQALLTAGTSIVEASRLCGLEPSVGYVYVSWFFDVLDRRASQSFMMDVVIGFPGCFVQASLDLGSLAKYIAHHAGPQFLKCFLDGRLVDSSEGMRRDEFIRTYRIVLQDLLIRLPLGDAKSPLRGAHQQLLAMLRAIEQSIEDDPVGDRQSAEAYTLLQAFGLANRYGGPATAPAGLPAIEPRVAARLAKELGIPLEDKFADVKFAFPDQQARAPGPPLAATLACQAEPGTAG